MTALHRRLQRLERSITRPDPWNGMDAVVASLTTPELRLLIDHGNRVKNGQPTTCEQEASYGRVRDRLALVGISLP